MRQQLPLERICAPYGFDFLLSAENQYSYPAQPSVNGVCKGESPVPLCPVLLPFAGAKGSPRRIGVQTKLCKRLYDASRRDETITTVSVGNPSVSHAADSSHYTGETNNN
jgi:hypothetical protein